MALAIIVVVISIVTMMTATSLSNVEFSRTQNQATQYAQEGMETLRSIRNTDLTTFNTFDGSYCLSENSSTLILLNTCPVNIGTSFKRSVVIQRNNNAVCAGGTMTTVTVAWTDGKCTAGAYCHSATVTSCMAVSNINPGL